MKQWTFPPERTEFSLEHREWMEEQINRIMIHQAGLLQALMAMMLIQYPGAVPEDLTLCEKATPTGVEWHFEVKQKDPRVSSGVLS